MVAHDLFVCGFMAGHCQILTVTETDVWDAVHTTWNVKCNSWQAFEIFFFSQNLEIPDACGSTLWLECLQDSIAISPNLLSPSWSTNTSYGIQPTKLLPTAVLERFIVHQLYAVKYNLVNFSRWCGGGYEGFVRGRLMENSINTTRTMFCGLCRRNFTSFVGKWMIKLVIVQVVTLLYIISGNLIIGMRKWK